MAMLNLSILGLFLFVGGVGIAAAVFWGSTKDVVAVKETKGGSSAEGDTAPAPVTTRDTGPRDTGPKTTKPDKEPPPVDTKVNKGTGDEDPVAYVPAGASIVAGIDVGTFLKLRPEVAPVLTALLGGSGSNAALVLSDPKKEIGLEFTQLVDQVLVSAQVDWSKAGGDAPPVPDYQTLIIKSKVPFDQKKVATAFPKSNYKKVSNKATFEISDPLFSTLYMPSDRILILTSQDGAGLESIVTADGIQPSLPAETLALVTANRKSTAWVVLPFDDTIKKGLAGFAPNLVAISPPELQPAAKLLSEAKGASFALNMDQTNVKMSLALALANEANAKMAAGALQGYWAKQKGPWKANVDANLKEFKLPADALALVANVFETTAAAPQGASVEGSVQLSIKAIEGLAKELTGENAEKVKAALAEASQVAFEKPFQISPEEDMLLKLVNKDREEEKLPALKPNPKLFAVARAHAAAMAKIGAADDEIDEKDNVKRLEAAGIKYEKADINLAVGAPQQVFPKWKTTAAEKEKYMGEKFTETGIGVARNAKGQIFTTQIYLTPKEKPKE